MCWRVHCYSPILMKILKIKEKIIMNKIDLVRKIAEVSTEEVNQKQVGAVLTALEAVAREAVI